MTRWDDLDTRTKNWILAFVALIIVLIILAWLGYFSGNWEEHKESSYGHGTMFSYQQAGWTSRQGDTSS